jgi:hypothetical protein
VQLVRKPHVEFALSSKLTVMFLTDLKLACFRFFAHSPNALIEIAQRLCRHLFIYAKLWKNFTPNSGKILRQTLEKYIIQYIQLV